MTPGGRIESWGELPPQPFPATARDAANKTIGRFLCIEGQSRSRLICRSSKTTSGPIETRRLGDTFATAAAALAAPRQGQGAPGRNATPSTSLGSAPEQRTMSTGGRASERGRPGQNSTTFGGRTVMGVRSHCKENKSPPFRNSAITPPAALVR